MTVQPFDPAFITQYEDSFTEVVRLGSLAAQKSILGKQSKDEDQRVDRLLKVLKALSITGLSDDDIESLEYDLISQNKSLLSNLSRLRLRMKRRLNISKKTKTIKSWISPISPTSFQMFRPIIQVLIQQILLEIHGAQVHPTHARGKLAAKVRPLCA